MVMRLALIRREHPKFTRIQVSHLQLERQLENIDFFTYHARCIVQAFGEKVAMLVVGRDTRIEAINDVIHATFDFLAFTAVIRLNAGKSAIGLKLPDPYLDGYQIKSGGSP